MHDANMTTCPICHGPCRTWSAQAMLGQDGPSCYEAPQASCSSSGSIPFLLPPSGSNPPPSFKTLARRDLIGAPNVRRSGGRRKEEIHQRAPQWCLGGGATPDHVPERQKVNTFVRVLVILCCHQRCL